MDMVEQQTVQIGSITVGNSGQTSDTRRDVAFSAEELGQYSEPGTHKGHVTDSRGVNQSLYRTADDRLIVHVEDWSHWAGEPTSYALVEVTEKTLTSRYVGLAQACGFDVTPLTLDQGLAQCEPVDDDDTDYYTE